MTRARLAIATGIICILTLIRVASTHLVFSPTYDEPAHIAAGYEYLRDHRYTFDPQHPPLSRALFAMPFRHATTAVTDETWIGDIMASRGNYMKGIGAARRGNLVFIAIAIVGVALWANLLFGPTAAVIACALYSMVPPVLAHGGLATTDMSGAAAFPVAMAALHYWLDQVTWLRTILLGAVIGFGLVTKLSFPLFFAIGAIVMMIARRRLPVVKGIAAHLLAFLIVFAVYRGHYDTMSSIDVNARANATELFGSPWIAEKLKLPAPEFFDGLMVLKLHDRHGHESYFMGEIRETGWWYYFPVLIAVKTPIPLLLLAAAGTWFAFRERRFRHVAVIALLMLASAMTSHINLGVRHLLPMYAPLSILGALAVRRLWQTRAKWAVAAACGWLVAGSALAHPDYLPWMNAFAGRHPEKLVLDSNFDWGQDVQRLTRVSRALGIRQLHVSLFGTVEFKRIGLPPAVEVDRYGYAPGWYALSESSIIPAQVRDPVAYFWLTSSYRFQRVGKTIRLYHVP